MVLNKWLGVPTQHDQSLWPEGPCVLALVTPTTNSKPGPWTIIYLQGVIKIFQDLPLLKHKLHTQRGRAWFEARITDLCWFDLSYIILYTKLMYFPSTMSSRHPPKYLTNHDSAIIVQAYSLCTRSRTHRGLARWGGSLAWWWRGCTTSWWSDPCQCSSSPRGSTPAGSWCSLDPACS